MGLTQPTPIIFKALPKAGTQADGERKANEGKYTWTERVTAASHALCETFGFSYTLEKKRFLTCKE